jgi:uncharacterized membrane protein YraQ (UPF0718 family)
LFLGFLRAGIPLSVVFTFLIASPMINEIAVIILIGVVGWKATLMFVAAGAIIAFFGGILMEKMGVEKYILNYEAIKNAKTMSMENLPIDNAWKKMHQYATTEAKKIIASNTHHKCQCCTNGNTFKQHCFNQRNYPNFIGIKWHTNNHGKSTHRQCLEKNASICNHRSQKNYC